LIPYRRLHAKVGGVHVLPDLKATLENMFRGGVADVFPLLEKIAINVCEFFAAISVTEDKMNKRANPRMRLTESLLPSIAEILRTSDLVRLGAAYAVF
jgi:hypothetical protein